MRADKLYARKSRDLFRRPYIYYVASDHFLLGPFFPAADLRRGCLKDLDIRVEECNSWNVDIWARVRERPDALIGPQGVFGITRVKADTLLRKQHVTFSAVLRLNLHRNGLFLA